MSQKKLKLATWTLIISAVFSVANIFLNTGQREVLFWIGAASIVCIFAALVKSS